jgi:hypothetical protein
MGHVQCPQSEPANDDLQPGRSRMVAATNCERVRDRPRNGGSAFAVVKTGHFDCRHWGWRRSYCEPLVEVIAAKVEVGLSAQRIYQDLVEQNGLRDFGGVPLLLNLDNLKAAVLKADWFDPEINPKLALVSWTVGQQDPRTREAGD